MTCKYDGCSGLTSVTIGNSVTSIGKSAFEYCSRLTSVSIPNSVTSIGDRAFYKCSGLTSVTIPNSVTSIGHYAFYGCLGLTSVTIPNSVTIIGGSAFNGCYSLTSVSIPNSVTSIEECAFSRCSGLTSVTIPNSVTSIGNYAFYDCSGIRTIHSQAKVPPTLGSNCFSGLSVNHVKLYVPQGTKEDYAFTEGWDEFLNIIEEGTEGMTELEQLRATIAELERQNKAFRNGDLNQDGRTDIDDVVVLITLSQYSSDSDALATLTDANSITTAEISEKWGDVEYFTLDGTKVSAPSTAGIYLVKKDGQTKMIVVKK